MFARLFSARKKPERPYLKLCKKCGGKGQISYFNQFQDKVYAPCDYCSNGSGPYALGVSLKCKCQENSVPYNFVLAPDAKHYRKALIPQDLHDLLQLQQELGESGTALLLLCDECGARYLCRDGAGERRKISGNVEMNEADKDYNRHIAGVLVLNGIVRELTATASEVNNLAPSAAEYAAAARPHSAQATRARQQQAATAARVQFGAVASGGRMRPMSAPAMAARQRPYAAPLELPPTPSLHESFAAGASASGSSPMPASTKSHQEEPAMGYPAVPEQLQLPPTITPLPMSPLRMEASEGMPQSPATMLPPMPRLRPQPGALNPVSPVVQ